MSVNNFTISTAPKIEPYYTVGNSLFSNKINITSVVATTGLNVRSHSSNLTFAKDAIVDVAFASGCYVAVGTTDKVPPTSGTLIKISQDGNNWKWVRSPQIGNYESLVEKQTDGGVAEPPPFNILNAVEILQSGEAIIGGKGTGKNAKNLAILTNTKEVLSSSAAPKWVFPSLPFTSEVTTLAVGVTSQPAWFFHKGFFSTDVNNPQTTRVVHDLALVTLADQAIVSKTNAISGQYQMVRNTKGILYSEDFGISWLKTNVPNNFLKPGMTSNWNDQIFIYDSLSAYGPLTFPLAANFPILSSSLPSEITNLAAASNNIIATTFDGNIYTKNFVSTSWTKSNFDPFQYNQISNGSFLLTLKGVSVSDNAAVACVATEQQIFTSSDLFSQDIQMFNPSGFFIEKTQIQSTGNTDRRWTCIAMSHSGQYQTAGANDDLIYTSNDYGNTWTQRGTLATMKRKWKAIAMSANGSRQVAVSTLVSSTTDLGEVWMSADYGVTWTRITNGTLNNNKINFQDAAMSGDGAVIAVASANTNGTNNVDGGGMLWISINSGSTWNEGGGGLDNSGVYKENRPAYYTSINSIAMSQDGVKMAYSCSNWSNTRGFLEGEVGIMVSTDTGKTWNRTPATQDSQRYLKSFKWPHVRMSSDGGVLIAHSPYMFSPPTDAAPFWISRDFGTTWTKTRPLGVNANYPQGCSAITPDGMNIVLVHPSFGSYFFISSDSGNTWASKNIRRGFNNVAISSNGKRIAFSCDNTGYNGPVSLITQTRYHLSADMEFNYRTSIANFTNVFVSGNGQKITAVAKANPYPKQNETTILVQSNDAGTTWSFTVSALKFLDGTGTLGRAINFPVTDSSNIAMSYDGEYQLVTATVPSLGQDIYNNQTYIAIKSSEYGVWTPVLSSVNKFLSHEQAACAVSRDGSQQHLFAERIHVSKNFGSTFEAQPTRLDPNKFNQNWTKPNIKTTWNGYRVIAQGPKMPELILGTALTNAVPKSYILMPTRYWPLALSRGSYQRLYVDDKITNFIPVYNINTVGNQLSASGLRRWSKVVSSEYGEIGQYGQFVTGITSNVELSNWNSSITPPINSDGIFTSDNASSLYTSLSWTQRNPATLNWMDIAMSSSGQYQTMVPKNGTIYVSSNYGFTWATKPATALTKNWKFVLMSTDGKIQLAGGAAALYYSGDFGATWTVAPTVPATSVIIDASMSADGKNQTIITENGQIYSSFNYGAAWALNSTLGTRNWTTVDMASAGDIQFVSDNFGEIYRFTEYDGVWTLVSPLSTERVFPITTPYEPTEFKRSLRFRSAGSAYLNRTPTVNSTSETKRTFSAWIKRGALSPSSRMILFYQGVVAGTGQMFFIEFLNDTIRVAYDGSVTYSAVTVATFTDTTSWHHVLVVSDTTATDPAKRTLIYFDGILQTTTGTPPTQNYTAVVGTTSTHRIGALTSHYFDGYMADVYFVDGQALTPNDFGYQLPVPNLWAPKDYTGTYGANGFYLNFADNSSLTLMGKDSSGNNNNYTTNNVSLIVGSNYDSMVDHPISHGSAKIYSGWNPDYGLQFRTSANTHLTRTPTISLPLIPANKRIWTISFWVKRTTIGTGDSIFHQGPDQNNFANISFGADNKLYYQNAAAGTVNNELITAQTFTDTSKWYHIVVACNTTATNNAEKMKIYVDGEQITSFSKATYPDTNFETLVNSTQPVFIGKNSSTGAQLFDGILAEFYVIDGHILNPSEFAVRNIFGTWVPKTYSYSPASPVLTDIFFGAQGFYLNFADRSAMTTATIGNDASSNSNNWTPNNFLITDAIDFNATAVRGNYTTLSTLNKRGNATLTNANLTVNPLGSDGAISSNFQIVSGQWYWEVTPDTSTGGSLNIGIVNQNNTSWNTGDSINGYVYNSSQGQKFYNNAYTTYGASFGTGDVVGVAFDATAKTLTFYKNGVSQGVAFTGISTSVTWDPCVSHNGSASSRIVHINFGQRPFAYTPPAGFSGLVRQIGYQNVGLRPVYKQVKVSPDGGLITAVASLCSHISFDKGNNWTLFDGISSGIFDIQNVYAGTSPTSAIVIGIKDNQYARFLVQPATIRRDTTNVVLAGSTDGKIALSNNNGRNWTLMPKATNPFESNATAAVVKKIKYVRNNDRINNEGTFEVVGGVAASKGIYATASWLNPQNFVANAFIPTANAAQVINTVVNTEAGVFIGGDGGLVARSTNALKTTWAAETPNFGTSPIRAMEAVRPERSTATKVIAVGDRARVTIRQPSGVWDVFSLSANLVPITNGVVGSDSTSLAGGLSASAPNFVGGLKYILKTSPPVPFGITNNVTETFKIGGESQTVLQPSLFRQISALPGNIPDGDSQGWGRVTLDTTEYASGTTSVLRLFEITFSGDLNTSSFVSLKIQNPSAITVVDTRIRNNQKYTYNSAPMSGEWTITVTHDYGVNVIKKTISTSGTATITTRETYNNVPNLIDSTFTNSLYLSSVVADWDYGVTTSSTGDQISINYSPNIDNVSIKKYRQNPKIHYGLNNFYITGLSAGPMEISDKNANKFTSLLNANSHKPEIYLSDGDIVSVPVIGISNQDLPLIRFNSKIYNTEGEPYIYSPLVNSSVTEGSVVFPYQWNASSMSKDGKVVVVTGGLSIFNTTYTENDFYKYSIDGGITWSDPIYAGANTKLLDVAVSGDGNVIYIIFQNTFLVQEGLFISTNRGTTWTKKMFSSLVIKNWNQIRTNRDGSKVLITSGNKLTTNSSQNTLFFSTNYAYSFNTITFGDEKINTCAISENGKLMVVGRETNKVFYTTDNWKTRTEKVLTTAGNQINSLVATDNGIIIVVGENLLQFTKDMGGSWFNLNSPGSWNSVAISPDGVHTIVVGNTGKVLISRTAELDGWFSPSALWNQASTGATEYSFGQEPTPPNYTTDVLKSLLWNSSTLRGISNQNSISWSGANIDATGKKVFLVGKYTDLSTSIYDVEGKLIASPFVLGSTPVAQTPVAYISLPVIQKAGEKLLKLQGASERINSNSVSYNGFVWNSIGSPLSGVPTGISTNRTGAAYTNDKLLIVGSSEYYQYTTLSNTTNNFELTGLTNQTTIEYGLSSHYPLTEINRELSGTRIGERYGESIALSKPGGLLVVGAPNNNELPPRRTIQEVSVLNTLDYLSAGTGKVDIYQFNLEKEEWSKTSTLYGISEKSRFGYSVSVDEDEKTIAIGAPGNLTLFDRTLTNLNLYGFAGVSGLPISLASQYGKRIGSGAIGPTSSLTTTSRAASISLLPPGYVFTKFDNGVNKEIQKAVMSRDGKFLIIFETGQSYDPPRGVSVSSDFGKTFTSKGLMYNGADRGQATVYNTNSCGAISTSGQYQTIGMYDRYNYSRVFRSIDYGANWTSVSVGFVQTGTSEAAHKGDPICIGMSANGQYQIIGTDGWQVFTSNNHGSTWTQRTVASTGQNFYDVAVSDSGQYQTITTDKKIWISNDYGVTWIEKLTDNYWTQTAMSSDGKNRIVVSGVNGKVYVSTDFGANWSDKTTQAPLASGQYNLAGWFHARMSPDGSKMYIGDGLGIFWYSTNNGDTWRRLGEQTSTSVETFFVINNGDKLAMLASSGGYDYMWYSDNTTAGRIGTLPFAQFSSVVASSAGDVVMTTAEHNSIWTLSGYPLHPYQDWAQVNFDRNYGFWTSMRMTKSGAYAVACCGRNTYYELNKFEYSGVFTAKLVNGALTWSTNDILAESTYGSGLTSKFHWTGCAISDNANIITVVAARKVANSITNNGLIVCLSATAQANTTSGTDRAISPNGLTMKVTARVNDTTSVFTDVAMNSSGAIQLAARNNSTLMRSVDFGVTWTTTGTALIYKNVYVSPKGDLQIAGTTGGNIYVSTNAGETWTARGASKRWTGFDATPDGSVIVAAAEAAATYASFGAAVAGQPADLISVNPDFNGTIATNENIQGATATLNSAGGLHYSFDRGTTWTTAISGTSQAMWSGVAITSNGRRVIASRRVPYAAYRLTRPTSSTSTAFFETSTVHSGVTTYDGGLSANEVIAGTEPPGYVQVYSFSNNQWSQKGQTLYGEWPGENFGGSVSLNTNGNVLIVGSPFAPKTISSNLEWKVGSAKVYTYNSQTNSWNLSGTKFEGEVANASLGTSVSINQAGNVVAMGSPNSDAKIYSWVPTVATPHGSWVLRGTKLTGTKGNPTSVAGFGLFGSSLQLNNEGDRIIIGAPDATVSGVANVGTALIYQWNTPTANAWNFVYEISGGHSNSFYRSSVNVNSCNLGYSVAINGTGNIIAAGGPGIRSTAFLSPEVHYVNFDNNLHEVVDLKERPYSGVYPGTTVPNTIELKPLLARVSSPNNGRVSFLAEVADPSIAPDPSLKYQWFFNGKSVRAATQQVFVASGVTPENVGKYHVIVRRGTVDQYSNTFPQSATFNGRSTSVFLSIDNSPYQVTATDPRQGFFVDMAERPGWSIALNGSGTSLLFGAIGFDNNPDRTDGYGAVYSYNLPKRFPYKSLWTTKRHTNVTTPLIANYSTSTQNAPRCVAASPTEFVVGTTGKLVYSTNAETWNPVVIQNSTQTATVTLPHVTFNSIAYGGGYFCAVGTHGTIVVSNSANAPDKMFVIDGGSSTLSAQGHTFTQVIYNKLANTFVATGTKDLVTIRPDTVVSRVPTQNNTYNYFSIPSKPLTFLRDYNTNPDNPVSIASSGSTIVGVGRYGEITKINLF